MGKYERGEGAACLERIKYVVVGIIGSEVSG